MKETILWRISLSDGRRSRNKRRIWRTCDKGEEKVRLSDYTNDANIKETAVRSRVSEQTFMSAWKVCESERPRGRLQSFPRDAQANRVTWNLRSRSWRAPRNPAACEYRRQRRRELVATTEMRRRRRETYAYERGAVFKNRELNYKFLAADCRDWNFRFVSFFNCVLLQFLYIKM